MRPEQYWPPYGVTVTAGDLELRVCRFDDAGELIELVRSGIHPPDRMPFAFPWTDRPADELPVEYFRYLARTVADTTPTAWSLQFAVRRAGDLVGVQGLDATDFAVTRTVETGSWLAERFQGHGIGTRMRQAVCAFAIDELGAERITSGAFVDNPASLAVSRRVGYRANGTVVLSRRGFAATNQKLLLEPGDLVRGEPITVTGADQLRAFLGLTD